MIVEEETVEARMGRVGWLLVQDGRRVTGEEVAAKKPRSIRERRLYVNLNLHGENLAGDLAENG